MSTPRDDPRQASRGRGETVRASIRLFEGVGITDIRLSRRTMLATLVAASTAGVVGTAVVEEGGYGSGEYGAKPYGTGRDNGGMSVSLRS